MKKLLLVILAAVFSISLLGCNEPNTDSDKLIVAVTIIPQSAFVEAVAGDLVDIITIIPPGYSPGNYEPSALTMAELSKASVYFTIGVSTEDNNIIPELDSIEVVHLETIVSEAYEDLTFNGAGRDPHIWLSIKRVKVMVQAIADTLARIDPDNESTYLSNATNYINLLTETNETIDHIFSNLTMNKFIAFHPAYQYFSTEYGLDLISLEEDGKESTPQHLTDVIDLANQYNIEYVFYQVEIDSSQVESFADEINATIVELDPLSGDYINNLIMMANSIREGLR